MQTHHFSRNVKTLRKARGLTQIELAELSGVSQPTISEIERDRIPAVSYAVVAALSSVLGPVPHVLFCKMRKTELAKYQTTDKVSTVG